ncbi:restriction endonuclease subunit S [Desulfuromonas thiophila]|uniref:restriction endonuclease subunit S n=1 Tax=Desulfuromonas thiophila TaxID=57664 RepID=UPI0024A88EEB|nr:restriction endonuclease subunit S [Desulfuromonas thiophila]
MTDKTNFVPSCLRVSDLLEQHFDTAFAAPDGVAKLRELILTLAMQGKLVEQNPNDPPASELLKEIEAEKKRASHEGTKARRGKEKKLPQIKPEEVPYQLPQGWEWVRLGEIGIINPRNDAMESEFAGFVPMPLIPEGYSDKHQFEERPWSEIKKGYTHFADGDVGMAKITPCFENAKSCVFSGLPNGIGAGTTELHIFRNSFNSVAPRFLLYYLKNPNYISRAVPKMTGSAGQKRVPTPYFTEQLFPLPPLSEQHRIVARIDQLMARCDALEKLRKEREEKRLAVHAAAIKQLFDAPNGSAWGFIQQHFGALYTVKENVAELRKAILQLAVMGRLVPQDPNDPPASELLKEIEAEKQRLVKAGKIKKPKPLPPIKSEEVPYQLPQGWEWVRLGDAGAFERGKSKHRPRNDKRLFEHGTYPFVQTGDVSRSKTTENQILTCNSYYNDFGLKQSRLWEKGTLCITIAANIAETGFLGMDACFPDSVVAFLGIDKSLEKLVKVFIDVAKGDLEHFAPSTAQKNINLGIINELLFPLPPLPEQHRIVARIDQLMAQCDTLDQQIDAATGKQTELLNAVMAQV